MNSPPEARENGGEVMIEVDDLTRYYGPVAALLEVSFNARRGEILGFLGPNGAGKTTAMRILTGYLPPTSGAARVAGHDVVDESMAARRAIGYLPETTPLYTEMTVAGYLTFMARLRGIDALGDAVERAMEQVAVADHADHLISHLSKGYRQRVGLAQALVHDPEVLILDEPTIGLDPRQIREVRELIRRLGGERTLIMSTHILPEAQQVCDRVLIIDGGRIVAEDTPDELTARLTGGEMIQLAVAPDLDEDTVTAVLSEVAGVAEVESVGGGIYRVVADREKSPRSELAASIVGRGWPLMELRPVGLSLEDIFLQLTGEEAIATTEPAEEVLAPEGEDEEAGSDASPGGDSAADAEEPVTEEATEEDDDA